MAERSRETFRHRAARPPLSESVNHRTLAIVHKRGHIFVANEVDTGMGWGFQADTNAIFTASTSFLSMKDYLASVEGGLAGDLQASAGMAGDDAAGTASLPTCTPLCRRSSSITAGR